MKSSNAETSGSRHGQIIAIAVLVVIVVGAVTGIIIYADRIAPFRATVLEVDDSRISMRYFLKRASKAFDDPMTVLQALAAEEIIKQVAPNMPYGINVADTDIDRALREIASSRLDLEEGESLGEGEFETWYSEELKNSKLSDAEYREKVMGDLLGVGLSQYLAERVPTVAAQVHLQVITLGSIDDARAVKQRLDNGESFLEVAEELKANGQLLIQDIDQGWRPRSGLPVSIANVAFDSLEVGQYSEPLLVNQQYYAIFRVVERAAARQVEEEVLEVLKSNVFDRWLQQELPYHTIVIHGLSNGYDQETDAWIRWQIQEMTR